MLPILRDAILLFFACFFVRSFAGRSLLISISLLAQIRLCFLLLFSSFFFFFLKHFCLRSLLCFFRVFFSYHVCIVENLRSKEFVFGRFHLFAQKHHTHNYYDLIFCIWPLVFKFLEKKYYPHTIKTTEKTYRPHNFRLFYFIWYSFLFIFFLARASLSID